MFWDGRLISSSVIFNIANRCYKKNNELFEYLEYSRIFTLGTGAAKIPSTFISIGACIAGGTIQHPGFGVNSCTNSIGAFGWKKQYVGIIKLN